MCLKSRTTSLSTSQYDMCVQYLKTATEQGTCKDGKYVLKIYSKYLGSLPFWKENT